MKKILVAAVAALILMTLPFTAFAANAEEIFTETGDFGVDYPDEPPTFLVESGVTVIVPTPDTTAAPEPTPDTTPVPAPGAADEEYAPLTEMAYRLWEENKELILSGLSALFSFVVWMLTSKRYIPKINRAVNKLAAGQSTQDEQIAGKLAAFDEKLNQFSNYDDAAKAMQKVLDECRLDRAVLTKVIEMQAEQLHNIIEISGLPQVRKDQLYAAYRTQLVEIERLKGEGTNG